MAAISDADSLAALLDEVDEYYGDMPSEPRQTRADRIREIVGGGAYLILVARKSGRAEIDGMASCSFLWPAEGSNRSVYLKELYVRESVRRSGLGRLLLEEVMNVARQEGCTRVEWTADVSNGETLKFYEALGTTPLNSKLFFRTTL